MGVLLQVMIQNFASFSLDECLSDPRLIQGVSTKLCVDSLNTFIEQIYLKFYLFVRIKDECRVQMSLNITIQ